MIVFNIDDSKKTPDINLVDNDQYDQFYYDSNKTVQGNNFKNNMKNNPTGSSSYKPHINIISSEDSDLP